MLKLNLLSRERQKKIRQKRVFRRVIEASWVMFFGLVVFSVFVFVWTYSAQSQHAILLEEEVFLRDSGITEKLKKAKTDSEFVRKAEKENLRFSILLEKVFQSAPNNLTLRVISVGQSSAQALISGEAKDRESLLKFRGNLSNDKFFSKAELPIADLAKQNDIVFSLSAEFNPELLK